MRSRLTVMINIGLLSKTVEVLAKLYIGTTLYRMEIVRKNNNVRSIYEHIPPLLGLSRQSDIYRSRIRFEVVAYQRSSPVPGAKKAL